MNLKIVLLTFTVKSFGVSSTLQTDVSFDSASVLTILIVPKTEMSPDHQMLRIFFKDPSLS